MSERTPTTDLLYHLIGQRAHLIAKMSSAHQRGGDVSGWLPLLAQTQAGRAHEVGTSRICGV